MAERTPKVVVIGGTYVDMAIKCGQIPFAGQSVPGTSLAYTITGPGPNQAVQAGLCGCKVHLISKVGDDPFKQMVIKSLVDYNINVDYVYTAPAKNTGVVVTLVNSEGENASCRYTGANIALLPREIDAAEEIIAAAEVCLIHGRLPQDTIVAALRSAEIHNTKVILNPAEPIDQASRQAGSLPVEYFTTDILLANLAEAAYIAEQAVNIRAAKTIGSDLVARGVKHAVITVGRRGCMVVDREGADHIPAFEVNLVDQTGSGDAFAGALAASCAAGDDIRKAVKFASAAGALACTKFGSIEALPTKAEIIQLLQREDMDKLPGR